MTRQEILNQGWKEYSYIKGLTDKYDFNGVKSRLMEDGYTKYNDSDKGDTFRVDTDIMMFDIEKDGNGNAEIIDDLYAYYDNKVIFESYTEDDFRNML